MGRRFIDYDALVQESLRGVVRAVLQRVERDGLVGGHHFYISFLIDHPGVEASDHLREQNPGEMTIVLQHQFWGLKVDGDGFEVMLSFGGVHERLRIPFVAVVAFADPPVRFGLQFDAGAGGPKRGEGGQMLGEEDQVILADAAPPEVEAANRRSGPDAAGEGPDEDSDKVVTLDAFRKIDGLHKK